jgi:transcriptional regulator with XRE-family HTH domain
MDFELVMSAIVGWLQSELSARGWSYNALARRAGLSPAGVSQVMAGRQNPGVSFCRGVAQALNEPAVKVFRLAGLLPPEPERDETMDEILHYYALMTPQSRAHFQVIARAFAEGRLRSGDDVRED